MSMHQRLRNVLVSFCLSSLDFAVIFPAPSKTDSSAHRRPGAAAGTVLV
jgi:hypothetical protein